MYMFVYLPQVFIGSLDCLCPLWLVIISILKSKLHFLSVLYLIYSVYEDDAHSVNPNSIRERKLQQQVEISLFDM